jgi:hypothetical protein
MGMVFFGPLTGIAPALDSKALAGTVANPRRAARSSFDVVLAKVMRGSYRFVCDFGRIIGERLDGGSPLRAESSSFELARET